MTLNLLSPFLVPLLSLWWLKESFLKQIWWAIGLGFSGAVILLNPTWNFFHFGAILALASAATSALSLTTIRCLNLKGEPPERILTYLFFTGIVLSLPLSLTHWVHPNFHESIILLCIGIFTLLNQIFVTKAFQFSPAHAIAPFGYTSIVFATLFTWLLQGKAMRWESLLGAFLITGGGLLIRLLNSKKKAEEVTSS